MTGIIITNIICLSMIIVISIFCYTSYKSDKNAKSNIFNKNVSHTIVRYDSICKELKNIKNSIDTIYAGIDSINRKLNNKTNG